MEWQRMHLADVAPKHFDFARDRQSERGTSLAPG